MTTDLTMLVAACLLAVVQLFLYARLGNRDAGVAYSAGPRDEPVPTLSRLTGRAHRAYLNLLETLPLFAIAVLVAHVAGKADAATALASQVYLVARIAYVPAYLSGVPWLRSIIWGVALFAILTILFRTLV